MEAVKRRTEQREEFESHICLQFCRLHGVFEPRAFKGLAAEGVTARPGEGVPIGDRKTQVIFHALAGDDFVRVVMAEGQRVGAVGAFIFDLGDIAEKTCTHGWSSSGVGLGGVQKFEVCAGRLPPLSCRTSPPQGGRSASCAQPLRSRPHRRT
ncbi:hypothetical protein D3C72_1821980 [compost metagenome]